MGFDSLLGRFFHITSMVMKLRIIDYLWHHHETNFELRLTVLTNILVAILALFAIFSGEILSSIAPDESLPKYPVSHL